jgi:hypothetical protein
MQPVRRRGLEMHLVLLLTMDRQGLAPCAKWPTIQMMTMNRDLLMIFLVLTIVETPTRITTLALVMKGLDMGSLSTAATDLGSTPPMSFILLDESHCQVRFHGRMHGLQLNVFVVVPLLAALVLDMFLS